MYKKFYQYSSFYVAYKNGKQSVGMNKVTQRFLLQICRLLRITVDDD